MEEIEEANLLDYLLQYFDLLTEEHRQKMMKALSVLHQAGFVQGDLREEANKYFIPGKSRHTLVCEGFIRSSDKASSDSLYNVHVCKVCWESVVIAWNLFFAKTFVKRFE